MICKLVALILIQSNMSSSRSCIFLFTFLDCWFTNRISQLSLAIQGSDRNVLKGRKTLIFSIKNLPVLGLVDMASNDDGMCTTVTTHCYPPLFQRSLARCTPPRSCAGNWWEVPTDLEGKLKLSEFTWICLVLSCHRVPGHAVADVPTVRLVGSPRELPCFRISMYSQGSLCDFILCFSIVYIALGDLTRWFATSYSLLAWLTKELAWILLRAKSPSCLQQLNLVFGRFSMNVGGLVLTLEGMCSNWKVSTFTTQ